MDMHQVAHLWANKSKAKGKAGNVYFEGDTIFSYGSHFPIARHVQNSKGEAAVLFTRDTYSNSTAKHKGVVRGALSGLDLPVFLVSHVTRDDKASLIASFDLYVQEAKDYLVKAKRSRKYGEQYVRDADSSLIDARALSAFFRLGKKAPELDRLLTDAEYAKIQEANRKERAAQKERDKERERLRAIAAAEQKVKDAEAFAAWQAGVRDYCPTSYQTDENGSVYLRLWETDRTIVQTSRGARVPLSAAVKVFRFVKLCRATGRTFEANGTQVPVGDFALRSIDANGNIHVGCHYITWERIEAFAKASGFFDEPASPEALVSVEHAQN